MFHWHIVDSQSFPLVVPNFEDIARKGAYSADSVYTPEDVAHIVSYAGAVRPEFSSFPLFHTTSHHISTESLYSAVSTFLSYVFLQCKGGNTC
jgi:hypothetical protein